MAGYFESHAGRATVVILTLLALAFNEAGCTKALGPRPLGVPAGRLGQPTFVQAAESGQPHVTGLSRDHGWRRGARVIVERRQGERVRPVAIAAVVVAYEDAAQLDVFCQTENRLEGAAVRVLRDDEQPRAGRCGGVVTEQREDGRVRLNLGKQDGVETGDRFQVLDRESHRPVAMVQVREVADLMSWAEVLRHPDVVHPGMEIIYHVGHPAGLAPGLTIAVVNFDPESKNPKEKETGERAAKQFASALADAARDVPKVRVRYLESEMVRHDGGEEEGHGKAREIGRKYEAEMVVWGVARCSEQRGCIQPRFTIVDPDKLTRRRRQGSMDEIDLRMNRANVFELATDDPVALASGVLGTLSSDGERYADAAYYLGRAVAAGAFRGDAELRARQNLAFALYTTGQLVAARRAAEALRDAAAGKSLWVLGGQAELARIALLEGRHTEARRLLQAMIETAKREQFNRALGYALHALATLEARQGRTDVARRLYNESLLVKEKDGNAKGKAAALRALAGLEEQQGRVDAARELYNQSLLIVEQIGDAQDKAELLRTLGLLEMKQGRVDGARKLYGQCLLVFDEIGDAQGKATVMHLLAILEVQQGRIDEARKLYRQSLLVVDRIGDTRGRAAILHAMATLELKQGRIAEARKLYDESLLITDRVGDARGKASNLHALATVELQQGRVAEALRLYKQALRIIDQMGDVRGKAATLNQLAVLEAKQGRHEEARRLYHESLRIKERLRDVEGQIVTLGNLAALDAEDGRHVEARQGLTRALAMAEQIKHVEHQANLHRFLGELDLIAGRRDNAHAHLTRAHDLFRKLGMAAEVTRVEKLLGRLDQSRPGIARPRAEDKR